MPVRFISRTKSPTPEPRSPPTPSRAHPVASSRAQGDPLLSILIPTVPGREAKLSRLLSSLEPQLERTRDVEMLVLRDLRTMTIGDKRNRMIAIARGEYVAFVDDDDAVAPDYVSAITGALRSERPDVLCFIVTVLGHGPDKPCHYGLSLRSENLPGEYRRKPNHLMVWRRELATQVPFPSVRFGEDTEWANAISKLAKNEAKIDRPLYTYQFDPSDNSATQRQTRRP